MGSNTRFSVFTLCLSIPLEVAAASFVAEYPVPTPASRPAGIGSAAGVIWFTEFDANKVARIDAQGVITEITLPTAGSGPEGVMPFADVYGSVVFTEFNANKIGRVSRDGGLTEMTIPTPNAGPRGIAAVDNFAVWFAEFNADRIGRLTFDGKFTEFQASAGSHPIGVTGGPAKSPGTPDIWFTESGTNKIGRVIDGLGVREYAIPTPNSGPTGITAAQNGEGAPFAVWFTELNANQIGRITEDGQILEIPIPTPDSGPVGISFFSGGPEGGLWFTESRGNKIARVNPDNTITEFPLPTPAAGPTAILGTWFVESDANRIGHLSADWLVVAAAGSGGVWDTQLSLANPRAQSVTATLGPPPPTVCGICINRSKSVAVPGHGGALQVLASETGLGEFGTFLVTTQLSPDDDLPITRARILNRSMPCQGAEIPVVRFSTIRKLNPSVLTFPRATRGPGTHSNLVLAEVNAFGFFPSVSQPDLNLSIQAYSASGEPVGTALPVSLNMRGSIELFDILSVLGVPELDGGQIRVTKVGGSGLLWGLLATSSEDGTLSTSLGINP